jgi:glutamate-1-semialdehyde 2,1-aminomutase
MSDELTRARQAFADRNPESRRAYDDARRWLPGGHTRTVLTHPPFPLTFVSGSGATLTDADGHTYLDFLGDYTAGLLGHSERRVLDRVTAALSVNTSVGGIHPAEARLARLMCERFGLDRVRFTNSGTEANLMAITTAMQATGRATILVVNGGYHGGVLYFATGIAPWNAPYRFAIAPFNDLPGAEAVVADHAEDLAAVLVEPMLGSGGCLPADPTYLAGLFAAARRAGAVCIADEVMTSRHGRQGLAQLLGAEADITTYGKYIGGGFSFGAFGGRADLLDQYDTSPEAGRTRTISHAGTFNNNLASTTAGTVVLGEVFTADVAETHTARGDEFRAQVADVLARSRAPLSVTGYGSMMSLHARRAAPTTIVDALDRDHALQERLYLALLERGVYTAPRGMVNLSLPHTDDHLATFLDRLADAVASVR